MSQFGSFEMHTPSSNEWPMQSPAHFLTCEDAAKILDAVSSDSQWNIAAQTFPEQDLRGFDEFSAEAEKYSPNRERDQETVLTDIVSEVFLFAHEKFDRTEYWASKSLDIRRAALSSTDITGMAFDRMPYTCLLDHYVNLYFAKFHSLLPILWRPGVLNGLLHPVLYLVLASIGTLYEGPGSQSLGVALHEKIQDTFFAMPLEMHLIENDLVELTCALLLTRMMAFYYEQNLSFAAAYHLGSMTSAFAHRLGLFNHTDHSDDYGSQPIFSSPTAEEDSVTWVTQETKKRLAFGILRVETFMSLLLDTKPLIDYEQMNLHMPVSESIWTDQCLNSKILLTAVQREQGSCNKVLFSDLVRIALDRGETIPHHVAAEHELLLFGLYKAVWRFSHDSDLFARLCDEGTAGESTSRSPGCSVHHQDLLNTTTRKMADLRQEKERLVIALEKWRQGLTISQSSECRQRNRSIYLSSSLLYHISFLKLNAPVNLLQQAASELNIQAVSKYSRFRKIHRWAKSILAKLAMEHACAIWELIYIESSRPTFSQARYSILALIGLHQAAVAIWGFSGAHQTSELNLPAEGQKNPVPKLSLCRKNNSKLLKRFVELHSKITPGLGIQTSFSRIARHMAKKPLPRI